MITTVTTLTNIFEVFTRLCGEAERNKDQGSMTFLIYKLESDFLQFVNDSDNSTIVVTSDMEFELAKQQNDTKEYVNTYALVQLYKLILKPISLMFLNTLGLFLYNHNVILKI